MTEIWKRIKDSVSQIAGRDSEDVAIMTQVEGMSERERNEFMEKYLSGDPEAGKQEELVQAIAVWKAKQ